MSRIDVMGPANAYLGGVHAGVAQRRAAADEEQFKARLQQAGDAERFQQFLGMGRLAHSQDELDFSRRQWGERLGLMDAHQKMLEESKQREIDATEAFRDFARARVLQSAGGGAIGWGDGTGAGGIAEESGEPASFQTGAEEANEPGGAHGDGRGDGQGGQQTPPSFDMSGGGMAGGMAGGAGQDPGTRTLLDAIAHADATGLRAMLPYLNSVEGHRKFDSLVRHMKETLGSSGVLKDEGQKALLDAHIAAGDPKSLMKFATGAIEKGMARKQLTRSAAAVGIDPQLAESLDDKSLQQLVQMRSEIPFNEAALGAAYPEGNPAILKGVAGARAMGVPTPLPTVSVTGEKRPNVELKELQSQYTDLQREVEKQKNGDFGGVVDPELENLLSVVKTKYFDALKRQHGIGREPTGAGGNDEFSAVSSKAKAELGLRFNPETFRAWLVKNGYAAGPSGR